MLVDGKWNINITELQVTQLSARKSLLICLTSPPPPHTPPKGTEPAAHQSSTVLLCFETWKVNAAHTFLRVLRRAEVPLPLSTPASSLKES